MSVIYRRTESMGKDVVPHGQINTQSGHFYIKKYQSINRSIAYVIQICCKRMDGGIMVNLSTVGRCNRR